MNKRSLNEQMIGPGALPALTNLGLHGGVVIVIGGGSGIRARS